MRRRRTDNHRAGWHGLSVKAQAAVLRGLDEGQTYDEIAAELVHHGVKVSASTVSRWRQKLIRQEQKAAESQARKVALELLRSDPDGRLAHDLSQALHEYACRRCKDLEQELEGQPIAEVLDHVRKQEALNLRRLKLLVDRQLADSEARKADAAMMQAQAAVKRADLLEKKLFGMAKALRHAEQDAKPNGGVVPAETLRRIREQVYGLYDDDDEAEGPN